MILLHDSFRAPQVWLTAAAMALSLLAARCGSSGSATQTRVRAERDAPLAETRVRAERPGPTIRLRLSGQLEGRLEPCGCASGQVGGLARRSFANQQDRGYDLLLEGGNLIKGGSLLDELKLFTTLNVLNDGRTPYAAIGLGPADLALPVDLLADYLGSFPLPFVSSDLVSAEDAEMQFPARRFVEREHEGVTVRIASLTGEAPEGEEAQVFGLRLLEPAEAWRTAMEGAADETLRILMVHGSEERVRAAAALEPRPDLLVAVNATHVEPPRGAAVVEGVPLVHTGIRGRFLLDVTLNRAADGTSKVTNYRGFPLKGSDSKPGAMEDSNTRELILAHRFEVKEMDARAELAGQRPTANGATYLGSMACAGCHLETYKTWEKSKHAKAWKTLEDAEKTGRYAWPVTHYPDCIACHSVGYGEVSGFAAPETTPHLAGVGCEQCHGPGSAHVANPKEVKPPTVEPESCRTCHDYEQSPDFDYRERWKLIEHK